MSQAFPRTLLLQARSRGILELHNNQVVRLAQQLCYASGADGEDRPGGDSLLGKLWRWVQVH